MNVTATMTASGLDTAKKVGGARDNGIFLSFTSQFILSITHQSMEARPARVRATRREVADMWVMVKTSTKIVGCFYLRSDGLLLLSAAMIAIGGLTVRTVGIPSIEPIKSVGMNYTRQT
jgi:hypothetical protein